MSSTMQSQFFELGDALTRECAGGEALLCSLSAERSDFVRFNKALVRQAGTVEQRYLTLRLIRQRRQASATVALAGTPGDLELARSTLARVREMLVHLPEDPWLLIAETPVSTTTERRGRFPPAEEVVRDVVRDAKGLDFAGFYAAGTIYRGFANSFGQRNWHEVDTFNFDWSLHLRADKVSHAFGARGNHRAPVVGRVRGALAGDTAERAVADGARRAAVAQSDAHREYRRRHRAAFPAGRFREAAPGHADRPRSARRKSGVAALGEGVLGTGERRRLVRKP
jgi:predicted Zn-dependent protease